MVINHKLPWIIILVLFFTGIFAELLVHRPSGPCYSLSGRVDGRNVYGGIGHPAPSYELLRLGGWLGQSFLKDPLYLDDTVITPRLRMLSSVYQFTTWVVIFLFLLFTKTVQSKWKYGILFLAGFSPLAIKTSVLLQIDNTSGAVICGLAAILILLAINSGRSGLARAALLFAAGCIIGLGKQEWSMALLPALLLVLLVQMLKKSKTDIQSAAFIVAGLIAGNAASYLFDPLNYMRAFRFMSAFSGLSKSSPQPWQLERWWSQVKYEAPVIYVCFILQVIFILSVLIHRKQHPLKYLLFLYGTILLFTYLFINWNYEFRYYVPSLVILTVACIAVLPSSPPCWYNRSVGLLAATVVLSTIPFLLFYKPDRNTDLERIQSGVLKSSEKTILFINSGAGWNKPHIDYINASNSYEPSQKTAEKYEKTLLLP
jgi:hypothetical protein